MDFLMVDALRQSVESMSGGRNTVLYDDKQNPSIMVEVPRFKLSDIDSSWSGDPHPAFIKNGRVLDRIFISQYQNVIVDGRAYSIPGVDPSTSTTFDTEKSACTAKGSGWHQMSNAEWAAVSLMSMKEGKEPRGNTNWSQSHEALYEHGVIAAPTVLDSNRPTRTKTGSGPVSWRHDGTYAGIADLVGNIWERVSGFKIINGKIYVKGESGTPMNNFDTDEPANSTTGFIDTGLYYDYTNYTITSTAPTVKDEGKYKGAFASMTAASGVSVPAYFKHLMLFPSGTSGMTHKGGFWLNTSGERIPLRGALWNNTSNAGLSALTCNSARSLAGWHLGFRSAFAE